MWSAEVKTLDQGIMDHTIPTIQLTPLEQEAFTTALRASRFDEHDVLAEQIERDQGRLALTKDTTVDILNTFDSSGTVAPEPMKRVVEHARAEYERLRYANLNIDSAGEDDIRRRLDAQEAKAATADLALQDAHQRQTQTAERRLADVRDALSRSGVQGWQADDFGYADQVVAGEQHRF